MFEDSANKNNTIKLKNMKELVAKKKRKEAEANGLNPGTIKCSESTNWVKVDTNATLVVC